jgi:hypothetical protein
MAKTVYSTEQGDKGKIIDLDTGREVEDAFHFDAEAGEIRVWKVSDAYRLWQSDPRGFSGKPARYVAREVPVLDRNGNQEHDEQGMPRVRYVADWEARKGRFRFVPAGEGT